MGIICASTLAAFGQSASTGGNVLRGGDFEDQPALLAWDQSSTTNDSLIVQLGTDQAQGGSWIARLGGTPKTTDTLEQPIGALDQYAQTATISFYWNVENSMPGASHADVLHVDLVDAGSGQIIPLTTLAANGQAGWQFFSLRFSPENMGLYATSDYRLHLEADIHSASSPTAFDLDDASLTFVPASGTQGAMAEALPAGDPTLPPPVVDGDGDMQFLSTSGHSVAVLGTVAYGHNSDLPNTSSPDFPAHQQIVLQATGFASGMTAGNAVVKFEVQGTTTVTKGAGVSVAWNSSNSTYTITCTVPNSPTPNQLVTGIIKVKNTSTSEKASTPVYSISSAGVEKGFRWGFPDRIAANPVIGAGATTTVLGGGQLQITAPGLHLFKKTTGAVYHPTLFAKDSSSPPLKVRIKGSSITNSGTLWSGTWTADGAPTVCTSSTPCIATNQALELDLINPDNSVTDPSDYNYPSAKYAALKVAAANPVTFLPPSVPLVFGPGAGYGPTNSVGYTTNASGQPGDLAIRPLQGATNHVTFHGQNLYRIKAITSDDGRSWAFSYVTGPTASDAGWGTTFTAWAPTHAPGSCKPYFATKDDPGTPTRASQVNFTVEPSMAANSYTTSCLISGSGCPLSFPATGTTQRIESFVVRPSEASTVKVTIGTCSATQGNCSDFHLNYSITQGSPDAQGRIPIMIYVVGTYSGTGAYGTGSVNYPVTISSDYGTIETRNINLYH